MQFTHTLSLLRFLMKKVHRSNRLAVLGLAAIAMLGLTACQDVPTAPDTAPQLALDFTNAGSKTVVGGLNVWAYCNSLGYPTVGYKRGYIAGPQAAFNNWVCQTGNDQFNPTDPHPVNLTKACQWQHDQVAIQAHPDDPDHAWSWKCYDSDGGNKPSSRGR